MSKLELSLFPVVGIVRWQVGIHSINFQQSKFRLGWFVLIWISKQGDNIKRTKSSNVSPQLICSMKSFQKIFIISKAIFPLPIIQRFMIFPFQKNFSIFYETRFYVLIIVFRCKFQEFSNRSLQIRKFTVQSQSIKYVDDEMLAIGGQAVVINLSIPFLDHLADFESIFSIIFDERNFFIFSLRIKFLVCF